MPVLQRSSASRPVEAGTAGLTGTRVPVRLQARWLGAKRGASNPSLISRVTAKRSNAVAGRWRVDIALDGRDDAVAVLVDRGNLACVRIEESALQIHHTRFKRSGPLVDVQEDRVGEPAR